MHFAIAAGTPTVAIFGQPSPANWTPPESEKNLAVEFDPGCKKDCRYPECKMECIKELPVEDVMSAVEAQIKSIGGKFNKGDDLK
jgi:heptosyltransferase-3